MNFRALAIYLCAYLIFPPQIWVGLAHAQPPPVMPAPQGVPQAVNPPAVVQNDRAELRRQFHMASWKMAKLAKAKIPGVLKVRAADYYSLLEPYEHCGLPFTQAPDTLAQLDEQILKPATEALAKFLSSRIEEVGQIAFEPNDETKIPVVDAFTAPDTKVVCQASIWRKESRLPSNGNDLHQILENSQTDTLLFQEPIFNMLSRRQEGPVTDVEVRRWLGWLLAIREFRALFAKYHEIREDEEAPPPPDLRLSQSLGKKVSKILEGEKTNLAKVMAAQIFMGGGLGAGIEYLPKVSACAGAKDYCLFEGKKPKGLDIDENIIVALHAKNPTHGRDLDAFRKIGIKALMTQFATVNGILQQDAMDLPNSCKNAGDLQDHRDFYTELSKVDRSQWWGQQFSAGVDATIKSYRDGSAIVPVPQEKKFYDEAQALAVRWVDNFFRQNTFRAGRVGNQAPEPRRVRMLQELNASPFKERITEGQRAGGPGDYLSILEEKLRVWLALVQGELTNVPDPKTRHEVVEEMIRKVIGYVQVEALEAYVTNLANEEGLVSREWDDAWKKELLAKWRETLATPDIQKDTNRIAGEITQKILSNINENFDGSKMADDALTTYVRRVAPRVREAAQADDTVQYMQNLVEWKRGPWNLLPTPWNYHWQHAGGIVSRTQFDGASPRFFQIDDDMGHGYGYTMAVPDGTSAEEYEHLVGAMSAVAESHRDKLIEKLKAKGYTDELVRRQFTAQGARNVGVLADLILKKFRETVEAQEMSDRGRVSVNRRQALLPLLSWLSSPGARVEYDGLAREFSRQLYERHLKTLLSLDDTPARRAEMTEVLKVLQTNEIYLRLPTVDDVVRVYGESRRHLNEEQEVPMSVAIREKLRADRKTIQDSNLLESPAAWKKFCVDKVKCDTWVTTTSRNLADSNELKAAFSWRVMAATEETLLEFLRHFGASSLPYDGKRPQDTARATFLGNAQDGMLRAWAGWGVETKDLEPLQKEIDALLIDVSKAAQVDGSKPEAIVLAKRELLTKRSTELYPIWKKGVDAQLAKLKQAIATGDEKVLEASFVELNVVFNREMNLLVGYSRRNVSETLLYGKLASVLLPNYSQFRVALQERIQGVMAPQPDNQKEIAAAQKKLIELEDLKKSLEQKGKQGTKDHIQVVADIDYQTRWKAAAEVRRLRELELNRLVRNYLGGLLAAAPAIAMELAQKRADHLWGLYFQDQFLKAKTDARGTQMALMPIELLEDLNRLADAGSRRLSTEEAGRKEFLADFIAYCAKAPTQVACTKFLATATGLQNAHDESTYWNFVSEATPALFSAPNAAVPLVEANGEVTWFRHGPSSETPQVRPRAGFTEKDMTLALFAFASKANLDADKWKTLLGSVALPANNFAAWTSTMPLEQRKPVFDRVQAMLADTPNLVVANAEPLSVKSYDEWHGGVRKHLLRWDALKALLKKNGSQLEAGSRPEFNAIATSTFKWFSSFTPYRFDENRLKHPSNVSRTDSLLTFARATPSVQRRVIEDIEDIYNLEARRLKREKERDLARRAEARTLAGLPAEAAPSFAVEPFKDVFEDEAKLVDLNDKEKQLHFYLKHFFQDPNDVTTTAYSSMEQWRDFWRLRSARNARLDFVEGNAFEWQPALTGRSGTQQAGFETWLAKVKGDSTVEERFKKLKADEKDEGRKHLWQLNETFDSSTKSDLLGQFKGLLAVHDTNSRGRLVPRTYPYFLVHLNWNVNHYGKDIPVGPTADPKAPSEPRIAKLMELLVDTLELDMKSFTGWEQLLRKKGQPEHWLMIAQSRRNSLVGAGERRFLGTMVEAPYTVNPTWAAPNYNYRPFPIVDRNERARLCTSDTFKDWLSKTEDPALYQSYRTSATDRDKRPLYEQLVAVQGEMIGERDIQDGNPLKRDRFTSRNGKWDGYTFGDITPDPTRLSSIHRSLTQAGVTTTTGEVDRILRTREALIDFRRTMSELNLRYAHESYRWLQGRGNDIPQRGNFQSEVEAALKRFSLQMGSDGTIPSLHAPGEGRDQTTAEKRRETLGRAIHYASHLAHEKVFKKAKTDGEKQKLEAILTNLDSFYTEAGQKIEVKRAIKVVAENISKQLDTLCEARALGDIKSDADFQRMKKVIKDDAKLVYYDNLIQLMYFDSGWMPEAGAQPETRRLLSEIARDQADHKKVMENVGTIVNWLVAISLVALMFGRGNPALARMAASSRVAQTILITMTYAAAAGFAAVESYQIYEDFWGRPDEIALLTSIRDTQFRGSTPLMKDESAALINAGAHAVERDQKSAFRWSMHILGITAGAQVLGPVAKWAKGGAHYLLTLRNPMWKVNHRFGAHARTLELGRTATPYADIERMGLEEAEAKVADAYARALRGTKGPGDTILIEKDMAELLRRDANRQKEQLCKMWGLDAETLMPIGRDSVPGLEAVRARAEWLKEFAKKLGGSNPSVVADDMIRLVGIEADPALRHTPFLWSLFGLPYPTSTIRTLRKVREVAQADLDILALHDPEMLRMLAYFNQVGMTGGTVHKWEMFTPQGEKRLANLPRDVRKMFRHLYEDAGRAADAAVAKGTYDTAAEKAFARLRYIRECFEDVARGLTVDPSKWELVERFNAMMDAEEIKKIRPELFNHYLELFLAERGLAPIPSARLRMQTLHRLVNWRADADPLLRAYAQEKGATPEEVLEWMLRKDHPNYKNFNRPPRRVEAPIGEGAPELPATPEPTDIVDYAHQLRDIMSTGNWRPDPEFIRALVNADYREMANRLIRITRVAAGPLRPPGEIESEDFTPEPPPEVIPPTRPRPEVPAPQPPPTEPPVVTPNVPRPGDLPKVVAESKILGPIKDFNEFMKLAMKHIPEEERALFVDFMLNRVSAADLERALGAGKKDAALFLASAHTRAMEIAELLPKAADRKRFYEWCLEVLLSKPDRLINSPMSLARARETLSFGRGSWPTATQVEQAATAAKAAGKDAAAVDQAAALLTRMHPERRNLANIDDIALTLGVPAEYLPSQLFAEALANQRVTIDWVAENMARRLYGATFRETVDDSLKILGLEHGAVDEVIAARIRALTESLEAKIAQTKDVGSQAMHREAIKRIGRADHILKNRANFPARYEVPKPIEPRYELMTEDVLPKSRFYLTHINGYPKPMVERMRLAGIDKARLDLWIEIAEGRINAKGLSTEEKLSRLMHATYLVENTNAAGCFTNAETLDRVAQVLLESYVRSGRVRYTMTELEAQELIFAFYKKQNPKWTRDSLKLHQTERLEELWKALVEEHGAVVRGQGSIPKGLVERLMEATRILQHTGVELGARAPFPGIESFALNTKSHTPMEVLVALIREGERTPAMMPEIRRMIYSLLDGPHAKWASDGTHGVGDLFLALFGPESRGILTQLKAGERNLIGRQLMGRMEWARQANDTEMVEAYRRAMERLGAFDAPTSARLQAFP